MSRAIIGVTKLEKLKCRPFWIYRNIKNGFIHVLFRNGKVTRNVSIDLPFDVDCTGDNTTQSSGHGFRVFMFTESAEYVHKPISQVHVEIFKWHTTNIA